MGEVSEWWVEMGRRINEELSEGEEIVGGEILFRGRERDVASGAVVESAFGEGLELMLDDGEWNCAARHSMAIWWYYKMTVP
jgi:hypothetical protein